MASEQMPAAMDPIQHESDLVGTSHDLTSSQQKHTSLLTLPPEIRNSIWELVLLSSGERTSSGAIRIVHHDPRAPKLPERRFLGHRHPSFTEQPIPRQPTSVLNLLQVCSAINVEASGLYFRRIQLYYLDCCDNLNFWSVGQLRLNGITELTIRLGTLSNRKSTLSLATAFEALPTLPNLSSLTYQIPALWDLEWSRCMYFPWIDYPEEVPGVRSLKVESREVWKGKVNGINTRICFEGRTSAPLRVRAQTRMHEELVLEAVSKFGWEQ